MTTAREVLNQSLEAPEVDPVLLSMANLYIQGKSLGEIAKQFSVSEDRVAQVLERREVKQYVDHVYLSQGYLNRFKRLDLINQVVAQKVEEAILGGAGYSKRDLYDWLKLLSEMDKNARPQQKGPQVAVQVNNYDSLMKDLLDG